MDQQSPHVNQKYEPSAVQSTKSLGDMHIVHMTEEEKGCWYVTGLVDSKPVDCLIDTGATTNVLSYDAFHKLGGEAKFDLQETDLLIALPNGEKLKVIGKICMPLQLGPRLININMTVVDMPYNHAILGLYFLVKNRISQNFYTQTPQ